MVSATWSLPQKCSNALPSLGCQCFSQRMRPAKESRLSQVLALSRSQRSDQAAHVAPALRVAPICHAVCFLPLRWTPEDAAIAALFNLVDNYNQQPVRDYDLFPAGYGEAYNSNSFISGILNAGGFASPIHPGADVPGYAKPVPKTYFRPRPRRRSKTTRASSKSHQKMNADTKLSEAFA